VEGLVLKCGGNTFSYVGKQKLSSKAALHFHLVSRSQPFRFLNTLDKFVSYFIGRKVAGSPVELLQLLAASAENR